MKNEIDKETLIKALENEENEKMMQLTSSKIMCQKNNILQKMQIKGDLLKSYHKKLKEYRLIEDIDDITYGNYIRWFNIKDPNSIKLTNGAHICDIKICKSGTHIICKNRFNKLFTLIMDECIIFQKLNREEMILLSVINYLDK
jgi:hypothetical protein